jgi:hypothetical protein
MDMEWKKKHKNNKERPQMGTCKSRWSKCKLIQKATLTFVVTSNIASDKKDFNNISNLITQLEGNTFTSVSRWYCSLAIIFKKPKCQYPA